MTRFMILAKYDSTLGDPPMSEWDPADVAHHFERLRALTTELAASGELVDMNTLTRPALAKVVTAGPADVQVVTDGPLRETTEMLASYHMVDVDSEERALEIAAAVSAVPGPGGKPLGQRIEVRQVMFT
jgi:hypothetical protein